MSLKTVLFDTNAFSRLMIGDETVVRIAQESDVLLLCSVVLGELEAGFRGGTRYEQNKKELAEFLAKPKVKKIFSTESTTMLYGELMAVLRKAGTKIPTNDVWIGAFAKERGAAVLSFDHHMKALIPSGVELVDLEEVRHA